MPNYFSNLEKKHCRFLLECIFVLLLKIINFSWESILWRKNRLQEIWIVLFTKRNWWHSCGTFWIYYVSSSCKIWLWNSRSTIRGLYFLCWNNYNLQLIFFYFHFFSIDCSRGWTWHIWNERKVWSWSQRWQIWRYLDRQSRRLYFLVFRWSIFWSSQSSLYIFGWGCL